MGKQLKELRQLNGKNRRSLGQLIFWHTLFAITTAGIGNILYFAYCKFTDKMAS